MWSRSVDLRRAARREHKCESSYGKQPDDATAVCSLPDVVAYALWRRVLPSRRRSAACAAAMRTADVLDRWVAEAPPWTARSSPSAGSASPPPSAPAVVSLVVSLLRWYAGLLELPEQHLLLQSVPSDLDVVQVHDGDVVRVQGQPPLVARTGDVHLLEAKGILKTTKRSTTKRDSTSALHSSVVC